MYCGNFLDSFNFVKPNEIEFNSSLLSDMQCVLRVQIYTQGFPLCTDGITIITPTYILLEIVNINIHGRHLLPHLFLRGIAKGVS